MGMEADTRLPTLTILLLLVTTARTGKTSTETKSRVAPYFRRTPISELTALVNDTIRIPCRVRGEPRPWVVWYRNGENISSQKERYTVLRTSLEITNLEINDSGKYQCFAENDAGSIWGNVTLKVIQNEDELNTPKTKSKDALEAVKGKPEWSHKKDDIHYLVRPATQEVKMDCDVRGYPTPTITWFQDGKQVKPDGHKYVMVRWSLTIKELTLDDTGEYTCLVANEFGTISWVFNLEVNQRLPVAPIIEGPVNQTVVRGEDATFECKVLMSDSQPLLQWLKHIERNGSFVNEKGEPYVEILQGETQSDDPQYLVLHNVTEKNEGWYTCLVANSIGMNYVSAWLKVVNDCGQPATGYIAADTRYIGIDVAVRCDETNGYYGSATPASAMCRYDGTWADGTWYFTGCEKVTFSSWSPWSDCSIPCEGAGISTRSRSCQYPPNSDGTACLGHLNEIKACDNGPCSASSQCGEDYLRCPQTGKCIKNKYRCDGYYDCHDYSDEYNCETRPVCSSYYEYGERFLCNNNTHCISHYSLCDGYKDCPGGEDEDKCDEHRCYEGIKAYVQCPYYSDCFLLSKICGGGNVCRDWSKPNVDCDAFACPEGYFKCNNGKCLRESKVCDGSYDDCGDESDESNCTYSCAGRCNKSKRKYGCSCSAACHIDDSCCHDYKDVCETSSTCTDLVDLDEKSMKEVELPVNSDEPYLSVKLVLRDSFNWTDSSIYLVYKNYSCRSAETDGCHNSPCTSLVIYNSYNDVANGSFTSKLTLAFACFYNTIRIYNRHLYCHSARKNFNRFGQEYMATYINKIDLSHGTVISQRKVEVESDQLCNDNNLFNNRLIIDYQVDATGFWLIYKSRETHKFVIESIDTDDLGTVHMISKDDIGTNEISTKNPMLMMCGKFYHFDLSGELIKVSKAFDILDPNNVFDGPTMLGKNDISGLYEVLMQYNPATKEIFVYTTNDETKFYILSPQVCAYPYRDIAHLSNIGSTFLWSLVQTENDHLRQMVDHLTSYFDLKDPDLLSNITNTLLTCPDKNCFDATQSLSLYCIIKKAVTDLKIYSDHMQTPSKIILQTEFHMRELLQQQFNRELSSKINEVKLYMSHSFDDLKQTVISLQNTLQSRLGNYYSSLARYDQKKAEADVNFIYGRLETYTESIEDSTNILGEQLSSLFVNALESSSANIVGKARRVAFASLAAANPVDKILGRMDSILTLMDAIDELMMATRDLHRAIYIRDHVLPKIIKETTALGDQLEMNMKIQTSIKNMIQAGFKKQLHIDNTLEFMDGFLKEYNAYSPIFTAGMFANYEAMLGGVVDELCDVIFSGDTTESGIAQHVIVSKGSCLNIKVDVARLVANFEEMYDFQFDLMEAMASFVRASVAQAGALKLSETIDGTLTDAQREQNHLALKVHTLQMYTVNNIHMDMVVRDACNLIKYKKGGETTDYCEHLMIDPHTTEFDKLVAYPYETDMCAHDNIQRYVNIPARIKENITESLPSNVIDLDELYKGKAVQFKIPNSAWLVENKWLSANDVLHPLFIKQFQLYLPPLQLHSVRSTDVHAVVDMDGDNYIKHGGQTYVFSSPTQYNFRYTLGHGSCFMGQSLDSQRNPYNVPGCPDRSDIPCVTSKGEIAGSVFHPSIYANWKLRAFVTGKLSKPNPAGEIYIRAGLTICKTGLTRHIRNPAVYGSYTTEPICCSDQNMYHKVSAHDHPCHSCPQESCPNLQGYYCERNCTLVQP